MQLKAINKKTLAELNRQLGELQFLYAECEKAEAAGVVLPAEIKQSCVDLSNRISQFKATYFNTEV
jgi:hypothetical protein